MSSTIGCQVLTYESLLYSIARDRSSAEGEFLVPKVAKGRGEDGNDCSSEVRRGAVGESEAQKKMGEDRECDELWKRSDAVDGKAAKPLAQVVALGAKDEVF